MCHRNGKKKVNIDDQLVDVIDLEKEKETYVPPVAG